MSNRPNTRTTRVPRSQPPPPARTPWWLLGVGLGVVVLAVLIALGSAGQADDDEPLVLPGGTLPTGEPVVPASEEAYGTVAAAGTALPVAAPGGADPAVGRTAPRLEGVGLDGAAVTTPAPGRPTVVMFLAHWCPHCQAEVPRVAEWLATEGMPVEADLVAVATATDAGADNFPPGPWLHREGWAVPTLLDDGAQSAAIAYGVQGFPYFVAVGADGRVAARASGEIGVAGLEGLISAATVGAP